MKLHFTLDHDGYLPTAVVITEGKRPDVTIARQHTFAPGSILVFDRAYLDFAWFARLTEAGIFFVTRLKEGTAYDIVNEADPRGRWKAGRVGMIRSRGQVS